MSFLFPARRWGGGCDMTNRVSRGLRGTPGPACRAGPLDGARVERGRGPGSGGGVIGEGRAEVGAGAPTLPTGRRMSRVEAGWGVTEGSQRDPLLFCCLRGLSVCMHLDVISEDMNMPTTPRVMPSKNATVPGSALRSRQEWIKRMAAPRDPDLGGGTQGGQATSSG